MTLAIPIEEKLTSVYANVARKESPRRNLRVNAAGALRLDSKRLSHAHGDMLAFLEEYYRAIFGSASRLSPDYLIATLVIALIVYGMWRRAGRIEKGVLKFLFPKQIWRHKSTRLDIQLFALNQFFIAIGFAGRISMAAFTALLVIPSASALLGPLPENGARVSPWVLALILWLATDFTIYVLHRIFHEIPRIWPIHAVHHSAEVMTPITAYRQHPLSFFINTFVHTAFLGVIQGILIGTLAPDTSMALIAGVNAFTVIANLAFANFHHSHIWLRFPNWLEHIFISPAQHQIHHSTLPEHYNRNYGDTLAIWDLLCGTLMLSKGLSQPPIGLTSEEDKELMSHGFVAVILSPMQRVFWPQKYRRPQKADQKSD